MHDITSLIFYNEAHLPGFYNLFLAYIGSKCHRVIDVCIWNLGIICFVPLCCFSHKRVFLIVLENLPH